MSDSEVFADSYAKLRRARRHINELSEVSANYLASNPIALSYETKGTVISMNIAWAAVEGDPGSVVGDVVHNLRTSLDLMASALARANGSNDNGVYFPFGNDEKSFIESIRSKNFHRAGSKAVEIISSLRPYKGGNTELRALHDLDIQDKHKALILVNATRNIQVQGSYNPERLSEATLSPSIEGFHLIFPEGSVFAGCDVAKTLHNLMQLVESILETFKAIT